MTQIRSNKESKVSISSAQRTGIGLRYKAAFWLVIIPVIPIAVTVWANGSVVLICLLSIPAPLITWIIAARMFSRLERLNDNLQRLAAGQEGVPFDLTRSDEIGTMNRLADEVNQNRQTLIQDIAESTERVSSACEQLSASFEEINAASEEVASNVQQIAHEAQLSARAIDDVTFMIREISAAIHEVSDSSQEAVKVATRTNEAARVGGRSVEETVMTMKGIYETVTTASSLVKKLGERSEQITEIVSVITNIADQTNLLALNASIEAARAGDSGRGFAVVADEVRKLAEGSSVAADKIAKQIRDIQRETHAAVQAMEAGSVRVEDGQNVVAGAGRALSEIVLMAESSVTMVSNISLAADQMALFAKEAERHAKKVSASSEASVSSIDEAAASAEEITASMQQVVDATREIHDMAEAIHEELTSGV